MKDTIVYIGYNFPDKGPAGVRAFANAKALLEYGYDVKLISKSDDVSVPCKDVNDGMETWHICRPKSYKEWLNNLVKAKQYTSIIDQVPNVKAVIAFELPAISFLMLRRYCKRRGIAIICEVGEWQKWENLGYLGTLGKIVRVADINLAIRYAYKKSDALIVTSHYFKDYFMDVVPTLILPTLQPNRVEFINNYEPNPVRKFIYAGGIGFNKDMLCDIIHAFDLLRDSNYEFQVFGLTREQYFDRFPEESDIIARINEAQTKIIFKGRVSHQEVLDAIKGSDFSLLIRESSRRNNMGFPTKFGESINYGTPVIVSDFSDVVYYTNKYGVGIVTEANNVVHGLESALEMDDASLVEMHERCRRCNAFHYSGHIEEIGIFVQDILRTKGMND